MQPRLSAVWLILIALAGAFALLYLWFTLFPGRVDSRALQYFSAGQINQGRQYNRVLQITFIFSFILQSSFLLWLVFSGRAAALSGWTQGVTGGNYWGSLLLFFLIIWLALRLLNLPFSLYSSYFWQHRWGFSTQVLGSWWLDYFKVAGLELFLTTAGVLLLFWVMGRWPAAWWLAGASFISLWLVIQTFLWPVVISPLFNRFTPASDPAVVAMVYRLSEKARLPVDQVLVMDASRRTTRANAYFAGLGRTKRIVLYDTLLANYPLDEVEAVVAHEMAHWSQGHILRGLVLGTLGSFALWGLLFIVARASLPLSLRYPPETWAMALLFFLLVSFTASPLGSYFSRQMEGEADRVSVTLTGDAPAAVRLQVKLAGKNLSDVSPAAFIRWFGYSHPPAPDRIENILQAASR
ncbi:MAG: M48 family metallopeptidase [Firmicutes bacterium]|nr:M48 family metallopeptidase [Bacillota bacterium]